MWVIHHCLAWGSRCQPQSWADFGEMIATLIAALAALTGLWLFLNWLDDRLGG